MACCESGDGCCSGSTSKSPVAAAPTAEAETGGCCSGADGCSDGCSDGCCDGDEHQHHHHDHAPKDECCSLEESCVCTESCEETYAALLHTSSSCRRPTLAQQTCAHCLRAARTMTAGAKACYCRLTRTLCQSIRSVATGEFAGGCCRVNNNDHRDCGVIEETAEEPSEVAQEEKGDLERGLQYTRMLTLGVAGMHCSTCADDVAKIVGNVKGVDKEGVKVSFVLSRAEVRYDPRALGVEEAVTERILRRFPRLEVVALGDTEDSEDDRGIRARILCEIPKTATELLKALDSVELINAPLTDNGPVDFSYNPDRIGIRHILRVLRAAPGMEDCSVTEVPDSAKMAEIAERRHLQKIGLQTILAGLATIPVLVLAWSGDKIETNETVKLSTEMACSTVVMMIAHEIFLDAAWSLIFGGAGGFWSRINIDCLVSIATLAAYGFSVAVWAAHLAHQTWGSGKHEAEPFFETSSLLITLILAGRWVTAGVRSWASRKLRTVGGDAAAKMVDCRLIQVDKQGDASESLISVLELEYDDILAAANGEGIVTDGLIIEGTAQLDESHLTGEPKPQSKSAGSYVLAGSMVVSGDVRYRVTKLMQENTISTIKGMVKLASQRPRTQEIADRAASILTPVILLIGIIVFLVWILVRGLQGWSWGQAAITATTYAVATLAISCPCAIGLAVPIVIVVASRVGVSKGGFVLKNPAVIEKVGKLGVVAFDKTGTLSTGQLQVEQCWALDDVSGRWTEKIPEPTITILRTLTRRSDHPVAKSIFHAFPSTNPLDESIETVDHVGNGIEATISGTLYLGGKLAFTSPEQTASPTITALLQNSQSIFTLSADGVPICLISLKDDTIRPEVPTILSALRARGVDIYIFSGDRPAAVLPLAHILNIPESNVFANCYPQDKAARLKHLSNSHPNKTIMFVGDGTNDAVALAAADIGVSVSRATEMATATADVALLKDGIGGMMSFTELAERAVTAVKINFAWAVLWNVFAILGASGAFVGFRIAPEWAGLGEVGSVLPVFLVSAGVGWGFVGFVREGEVVRRWWR